MKARQEIDDDLDWSEFKEGLCGHVSEHVCEDCLDCEACCDCEDCDCE